MSPQYLSLIGPRKCDKDQKKHQTNVTDKE